MSAGCVTALSLSISYTCVKFQMYQDIKCISVIGRVMSNQSLAGEKKKIVDRSKDSQDNPNSDTYTYTHSDVFIIL